MRQSRPRAAPRSSARATPNGRQARIETARTESRAKKPLTEATPARRASLRLLLFSVLAAGCVAASLGYVLWAMLHTGAPARNATGGAAAAQARNAAAAAVRLTPGGPPQLLFRSLSDDPSYGSVAFAPLEAADSSRTVTALRCDRVYMAAGHGLCLSAKRNALGNLYSVATFGPDLQPHDIPDLRGTGIPSRARVSPDGRYGAFTVFDVGHSYAVGTFSTRTVLLDLGRGVQLAEMEDFAVWRDGTRLQSADFNFWGVTFARDSDRFYATLGSGGKTYLIEGDVPTRQARVLRENVECPSLSPDNTRIAFKKQVGSGGQSQWRLYVLDLATMSEMPLAEASNIDDQVEWLDDGQVAYALPEDPAHPMDVSDVWAVSADGIGTSHLILRRAASPTIAR